MSYHLTNFGSFGGNIRRFADVDGYVPEAGDSHEDLRWDAMTEWDDESWHEFVSQAVAATEDAQKELSAWRCDA